MKLRSILFHNFVVIFSILALGLSFFEAPKPVIGSVTNNAGSIASGYQYSCGVVNGGVKCWGSNNSGELGDGTNTDKSTSVDVIGLTSGITAVAAKQSTTCALTVGGGVKCWGYNASGQLGDGTTTDSATPVDVVGLTSGVEAVTVGDFHTCALTTTGGVKCWGSNEKGQIGDGATTDQSTPVDVIGLTSGVIAVSAGSSHTCALTTGGGVKCWGWNLDGEVGDGSTTMRKTPVDVSGLTNGITAISTGSFITCAITSGGGVKCWGRNDLGGLGDGTATDRHTPVDVSGLTSGYKAVNALISACAISTSGGVKCWGRNSSGELGDGSTTDRLTPVDVIGLTNGISDVAVGVQQACAVNTNGGLLCWGRNNLGQLGDGSNNDHNTPVDVFGLGKPMPSLAHVYLAIVQYFVPKITPTPTPVITLSPTATAVATRTPGPTTIPPSGPADGLWRFTSIPGLSYQSGASGFRVSSGSITSYSIWVFPVSNWCMFLYNHTQSTAISGGSFSFSDYGGDFTANGTFTSSTAASGYMHISNDYFPAPQCNLSSMNFSGGWQATWAGQ